MQGDGEAHGFHERSLVQLAMLEEDVVGDERIHAIAPIGPSTPRSSRSSTRSFTRWCATTNVLHEVDKEYAIPVMNWYV